VIVDQMIYSWIYLNQYLYLKMKTEVRNAINELMSGNKKAIEELIINHPNNKDDIERGIQSLNSRGYLSWQIILILSSYGLISIQPLNVLHELARSSITIADPIYHTQRYIKQHLSLLPNSWSIFMRDWLSFYYNSSQYYENDWQVRMIWTDGRYRGYSRYANSSCGVLSIDKLDDIFLDAPIGFEFTKGGIAVGYLSLSLENNVWQIQQIQGHKLGRKFYKLGVQSSTILFDTILHHFEHIAKQSGIKSINIQPSWQNYHHPFQSRIRLDNIKDTELLEKRSTMIENQTICPIAARNIYDVIPLSRGYVFDQTTKLWSKSI
jgi:hypothetical protein